MRKIILAILTIIPLGVFAQTGRFVIKGKIGHMNAPAVIFINYTDADENYKDVRHTEDTCILKDGYFELSGTVKSPVKAQISLAHFGRGKHIFVNDVRLIYVEPGTTFINSPDSLSKATITGSKLNDDEQQLFTALNPIKLKQDKFNDVLGKASPEEQKTAKFKADVMNAGEELTRDQNVILLSFIEAHPNSIFSLVVLERYEGEKPDVAEIQTRYNNLSSQVQTSTWGKRFQNNLNSLKSISIGGIAPNFTQNDINGRPVKLSDFKGKYVLLDFWASWCAPCRAENPNVLKQYNEYKDKNFTVLGVSLDKETDKSKWIKAINNDKLIYNQVSDLKGLENEAAQKYNVQSIPDNFLIGPDGKIIARGLRGEDLARKLNEILNK